MTLYFLVTLYPVDFKRSFEIKEALLKVGELVVIPFGLINAPSTFLLHLQASLCVEFFMMVSFILLTFHNFGKAK